MNGRPQKMDVLGIMWGDAADAAQYRGMFLPESRPRERLAQSDEARLIIKSLIEALRDFSVSGSGGDEDRWRYALSRIKEPS